ADREIMLAGISHDLRTPLARMRLEIELSQVSDETRAAIDEDLAQIDHSIGQLMEYARPAAAVPEHGIDVSAVLNDVYERERTHTESLGGILTASVEPNLYARISAHDLKRIVSNLIENARRYGRSPEDDRARIELSAHQHGNILVIAVKDQGAGIAKGDIQRLLRPFSRGVSARTGVSGAGLGLAIVERLLGQVGGHFELVSAPSEGLTARIQLPRIRASRNAPGTQADKDSKLPETNKTWAGIFPCPRLVSDQNRSGAIQQGHGSDRNPFLAPHKADRLVCLALDVHTARFQLQIGLDIGHHRRSMWCDLGFL